jgi:hypothetical protein
MKTFSLIGLTIVIILSVGISSGGLATSQTLDTSNNILNVTKAVTQTGEAQAPLQQNQAIPDDPIFSWPIVISLGVAVIGIVAFRRNTYF